MLPIPKLHTEQISLRPFTTDDIPDLYAYLSHPELAGRRYIPWKFEQLLPLPLKQVEGVIEEWNKMEDSFTYAVIENQSQTLIGHAASDWGWDPHMPGCSVVIDPAYQRQGYGTQALTLLIDYLYDFSVAHNLSTWIAEWNAPALAFVQRMGFTNVGSMRRAEYHGGRFYAEIVFDLLRPEWKERRHAA